MPERRVGFRPFACGWRSTTRTVSKYLLSYSARCVSAFTYTANVRGPYEWLAKDVGIGSEYYMPDLVVAVCGYFLESDPYIKKERREQL